MDSMVNNAGISTEVDQQKLGNTRLHETETQYFDLTMNINTRGVFLGCKYALAQFLKQAALPPNSRGERTGGWIINLASIGGHVGLAGAPSYAASKHAVIGLTRAIAVSYAKDKIHCNALSPGCKSDSHGSVISSTKKELSEVPC